MGRLRFPAGLASGISCGCEGVDPGKVAEVYVVLILHEFHATFEH